MADVSAVVFGGIWGRKRRLSTNRHVTTYSGPAKGTRKALGIRFLGETAGESGPGTKAQRKGPAINSTGVRKGDAHREKSTLRKKSAGIAGGGLTTGTGGDEASENNQGEKKKKPGREKLAGFG